MVKLLGHDDYKFPNESGKRRTSRPRPVEIDACDDDTLQIARELIDAEMEAVRKERGELDSEAFATAWEEIKKAELFIPSRGANGTYGVPANKAETISSLKQNFEVLRSKLNKDANKASKLEQKIKITQHGYTTRSEKVWNGLLSAHSQYDTSVIELASFEMLKASEERVIPHRIYSLVELKKSAEALEASLQQKYAEVMSAK